MALPQPIGEKIGEWEVVDQCKDNPQKYIVRCRCGTIAEKYLSNLRRGYSPNCGGPAHKERKTGRKPNTPAVNTVGQKFNHWTVLEELGKGKVRVQCDCEAKTEGIRYKKAIISGESKSCGCAATPYKTDLIGKTFGHWKVIGSAGNGMCLCECSCENHTQSKVSRANLLNGNSTSCGCEQANKMKQTMLDRYGEIAARRLDEPREKWKIELLHDAKEFRKFILKFTEEFGKKPTINDLCSFLDIQRATMLVRVHEHKLEDIVDLMPMQSQYEDEIVEIIKSINNNIEIIRSDRHLLDGFEIDIYLPTKKIAIEFNDTYWHSSIHKDKDYHQNKTIKAFSKCIHLIHIFEYEWKDPDKKRLIIQYLKDLLDNNKQICYARNCTVKEIDNITERDFEENYHLQGYAPSKLALGLYSNNELISVMSFGTPRFDKNYDWELIRYCVKSGYAVTGGKEKLFKYFVSNNKNISILTYVDISKFTGMSYFNLGFTKTENWKTQPGYVWVNPDNNKVLSRYRTQKSKLVDAGLGKNEETEDEIMTGMGYYKVYDSGNLKLKYIN